MSAVQTFYRYFPVSERDRKWGFHITTAGESRIPPHYPYPPLGHPTEFSLEWTQGRTLDAYALVYISAGHGWFESRKTGRQRVESGHVMMIHRGIWHRYQPDPETGWHEHWVGFDGSIPQQWVTTGFFLPDHPILKVRREDILLDVFTNIMETIKSNQPALQQVVAGATGYILSLLYSSQRAHLDEKQGVAVAIHKAIHLMTSQPEASIDLRQLSSKLNVSYTWFRRSFQQHTGLSPYQYLLQLRVAKARRLLAEADMTIQQISAQSGFESEQYFCRLFKNKTGMTPGTWRDHSRKGLPPAVMF